MIGRVVNSSLGPNKDGVRTVVLLEVELTDPDDIQTVELLTEMGLDYRPTDDSAVVVLSLGPAWKVAIACDDRVTKTMDKGEKEIYSLVGTTKKASIKWLADGVLELNGNEDFAVRFNELKTAFDQLKSDFDDHTHVTTATISTGPAGAISPPSPSTADIDPAKIEEIKVPS